MAQKILTRKDYNTTTECKNLIASPRNRENKVDFDTFDKSKQQNDNASSEIEKTFGTKPTAVSQINDWNDIGGQASSTEQYQSIPETDSNTPDERV